MSANPQGFVELDRQFMPVKGKPWAESTSEESYSHLKWWMHGPSWRWDDLLGRTRVVVLGEAGSGKTAEFQRQVSHLTGKGIYAFFVKLDQLISDPLDFQLGHQEWAHFQRWSESIEEAYFFLDSVDEAKVSQPADLHRALRRFRAALPLDFKPRAHVFVSSRASDWHPTTDGVIFTECFGLPAAGSENLNDDEPSLTTVHLAPLEWPEISRFLTARGVNDQSNFYHHLRIGDAEEFVRRPLDLLAMVDLWQQDHRLGSLTDIIEADLTRKLVEMPSRSSDRLSREDARIGVEALAAATVLCGRPVFRVGNETNGNALDPRTCLSATWDEDRYRALMRRPIFDCASRGLIRFHHRRVREYLAASWIKSRMDAGCALTELESMLFVTINGRHVIRRSLAPVAAWLVVGNDRWSSHLRKWILDAAPGVHFQFGDAGALPLDYKRAIIRALLQRHDDDWRPWFEPDDVALRRFTDSALDEDVSRVIRDRSTSERLRLVMLKMARLAPLKRSTEAAFELIKSGKESGQIVAAAVAVAAADASTANLQRLRDIAIRLPSQPEQVTATLLDELKAERLQIDEAWKILKKTAPIPESTNHGYSHLRSFLEHNLPRDWKGPLLRHMLEDTGVSTSEESRPSQPSSSIGLWVASLIPAVVLALLSNDQLSEAETNDIVVAMRPGRGGRFSSDYRSEINKATHNHPRLRQLLFWDFVAAQSSDAAHGVDRIKAMLPDIPTGPPEWDHVLRDARSVIEMLGTPSEHMPLLTLTEGDLIWLREDSSSAANDSDEYEVARKFAGLVAKDLGIALKVIERNEENHRKNRQRLRQQMVRSYRRQAGFHFVSKRGVLSLLWQWFTAQYEAIDATLRLYSWLLHRAINTKPHHRLQQIPRQGFLLDRIGHRLAKVEWDRMAAEFEPARLVAAQHWRRLAQGITRKKRNPFPPNIDAMMAAVGIQTALEARDFSAAALSTQDVKWITLCALHAPLWSFPAWFLTLMEQRPDDVDVALAEAIAAESAWGDEPSDLIERMCDIDIGHKTQAAVIDRLTDANCRDEQSVTWAIQTLLRQENPPFDKLTKIARSYSEDVSLAAKWRAVWLSVWLRCDISSAIDFAAEEQAVLAEIVVTAYAHLHRAVDRFNRGRPSRWLPSEIERLLPLVHLYTAPPARRPPEVSESDWKAASELEDALWDILCKDSTEAATDVLGRLAASPNFTASRGYILRLRNEQISRCFDLRPWRAEDIREFERMHETDPRDDLDLFRLGLKRLGDVKMDVENSDSGLRAHLRIGDDERRFRIWLANELVRRANQRYVVPQESVIDREQRPDIRLEHPNTAPVSIEIKWADDRSLSDLIEGLEKQLVGQYLRAHHSRCGIYVVGLLTDRQWYLPSGGRIGFQKLAEFLSSKADKITDSMLSGAKRVAVVTIDFRDR